MSKSNGTQTVERIPGRNIIISTGIGKSNLEELKWLADAVLEEAMPLASTNWAYIGNCSQMAPVTSLESNSLIEMTRRFAEAGCQAFAFVEGKSFMQRIQTRNHTKRSGADLPEGHFATVEEALDWIAKEIHF